MNPSTTQRLERLRNHATLYELTITAPDGRKLLVAYCQRKGRQGVFKAVSRPGRAERLIALTGDKEIHFGKRVSDGARMGDWSINFTGRTERQSIMEGELEYVGN